MPLQDNLVALLSSLNVNRNGDWPAECNHSAPHKPLMLLSVISLIESRIVIENLIRYDDRLLSSFDLYWRAVVGDRPTNILQPF
jgi:predicted restriction endonuclease